MIEYTQFYEPMTDNHVLQAFKVTEDGPFGLRAAITAETINEHPEWVAQIRKAFRAECEAGGMRHLKDGWVYTAYTEDQLGGAS